MIKVTMANLKKYYSIQNIARILKELPPLNSPVMDLVYPEAKRQQWQGAILPFAEIKDVSGNVPVVRRGTGSHSINGAQRAADFIEPQPIYLNRFTSAKDINDLLATGLETNMNLYLASQVEILRRKTRMATEIMAAQSLTGRILYKMKTEGGGLEDYEVNFGTVPSLEAVDITNSKAGDVYKYFEALHQELVAAGYTGNVVYLAGTDVYAVLVSLAADAKNTTILADEKGILIAGKFRVIPASWTYKLPGASVGTSIISAKSVKAIDLSAPFTLFYCALDDMDNNLAALPFLVKPKVVDDPDGIKNISNSKPLPAPVLEAMVDQVMLP